MDANKEDLNECRFCDEEAAGEPNLCCCYAMDDQGSLEDACTHPVEDCCCC